MDLDRTKALSAHRRRARGPARQRREGEVGAASALGEAHLTSTLSPMGGEGDAARSV